MVALTPTKQICYSLDEQHGPRKGRKKSYFDQIPNELITSIVARLASSSIADFSNAKLSCQILRRICDDGYVLKHATLEKIPIIPWPVKGSNTVSQISFFELCQTNGNPEALYRKGILDFFRGGSRDYALECLRRAKECGHLGASYAIGMILILTGEKRRGVQYLGSMKKDKNMAREVPECRNKLMNIIWCMWSIHNDEIMKEMPTCCSLKYQHPYRRGWCLEDDEKHIKCEACLCDIEVDCVYESLLGKMVM